MAASTRKIIGVIATIVAVVCGILALVQHDHVTDYLAAGVLALAVAVGALLL